MKGLLKFITCGSVDDGKSTLIGHILYDAKLLYADQEKALELDSKVGSREGAIDYSLLLDGLMAEREQGITIDVAYRYFTTEKRSFIVADTPGHEEYTRNMAVGASFADLAIILLDATQGVLVQTRRHARICALMGIRYFVFAVNKMDLIGYDQEKFNAIQAEILQLAGELGLESVKIIPVSATEGDNVTKKSDNIPWYTGEPILTYLEEVDVTEKSKEQGFYMPVQRVCRPNHTFRGFQGQIEAGEVRVGDTLTVLPGNETANVKSILVAGKEADTAQTGQPVTIQLDKEIDVSRGCVLENGSGITAAQKFTTTLLWMDDNKLSAGGDYFIKLGTKLITGTVTEITYKIDVNTGEHHSTDTLGKNEIAVCNIVLDEKIPLDVFKKHKTMGELILIDRVTNMTSACGVVESVDRSDEKPYFEKDNIRTGGYIFEEFYFNLENAFLSKVNTNDKTYHVGDQVPVKGDSFKYPDYFDIIAVDNDAAVLIRDRKVQDIIPLKDYQYMGFPVLDERGFALKIRGAADLDNFLYEYKNLEKEKRLEFHNKWSKFETYRRIVCTDNFWMI